MRKERVQEAKEEAERFLKRVAVLEKLMEGGKSGIPMKCLPWCCAESAAVKRASLDLTRSLAAMRKSV